MDQDIRQPAEEFKFGQGFVEDIKEIVTRLGLSEEAAAEVDRITKAGVDSLDAATIEEWGSEKTREIFKVFTTAETEAEPEIEKAWQNPNPETAEEIKAQIYIFGLMESVYRFIHVIRPAITGDTGVTTERKGKKITIHSDAYFGGKIGTNEGRRIGLERRLAVVEAGRKPIRPAGLEKSPATVGADTSTRAAGVVAEG